MNDHLLSIDRRDLMKASLAVAAATPLIGSSPAVAQTRPEYPRISYSVVAVKDRVLGLGLCKTNADLVNFSSTGNTRVDYSNELLEGLLQVSLDNGSGNPKAANVNQDFVGPAIKRLLSSEKSTITRLRETDLYWVQSNPWILLAPLAKMALFAFVSGFATQIGSNVGRWMWRQIAN
ncbi:MAG: hypothetical protein F4160_10850 [Rhodospirillaceae bacterium]|nr:hypothetical protein [Rhodospirillaceae bacterium]MYH37283.1 hypothetical protein [Rhodospirillaceae bacterium]MYK14879.1 hypothetical protein [Rhodospirillaceae bacterium]